MHTLHASASSSLSLPTGSYIYSLVSPIPGTLLSAISSDDSVRLFDAARLANISVLTAKSHDNGGVTSLRTYGSVPVGTEHGQGQNLLATGGRDGKVKMWDVRSGASGKAVVEVVTDKKAPVLSVACNSATNTIVAGTELVSSQAVVAFWDIRSPTRPRLQYVESHNDDVTELQFHPTLNHILLSGSTDGLVNVYDTNIEDEDDALLQVINHGSVHHAGYLSDKTIYALSHDELFSIHPVTDPDDPTKEPEPVQFGDVRETLGCEYVVQLCIGSQGPYIAAGNKAKQRLDLIPLTPHPSWGFDQQALWRLPGAHGEEVVRSVYLDEASRAVFTGGEDGFVRAWRADESVGDAMDMAASGKIKSKEKKHREKERFKPY